MGKVHNHQNYNLLLIFILPLLLMVLMTSCDDKQIDGNNPLFIRAQNLYEAGKYDEAIKYYNDYLKINPDSVKTNYQLAMIYQEKGQYLQSIFYYKRYLALAPDSTDTPMIEKWVTIAQESLYQELSKSHSDSQSVTDSTTPERIKNIELQNARMRDYILRHKDILLSNSTTTPVLENDNIRNIEIKSNKTPIYYTVGTGDTLYKISQKFYGTYKYYPLIVKANNMKTTTTLKVGDQIIIPELKK